MAECMNCGGRFDSGQSGYDQPNLMTRKGRLTLCGACLGADNTGGKLSARHAALQGAVRDNELEREYIERDEQLAKRAAL